MKNLKLLISSNRKSAFRIWKSDRKGMTEETINISINYVDGMVDLALSNFLDARSTQSGADFYTHIKFERGKILEGMKVLRRRQVSRRNGVIMLIYSCPNPMCRYSIPEVLRDNVRFDYPCPKCGKTNISDYYAKQKKDFL